MAPATPFTRSDISKRQKIKVESHLVHKLIRLARVPASAKSRFTDELELALRLSKLRDLGLRQERPTRVIAALSQGFAHTNKLLKWVRSLPPVLELDLKIGITESLLVGLITNINIQTKRYRARVKKHRPTGAIWSRELLQEDLQEIYQKYCPGRNSTQRDNWIAEVLTAMELRFPKPSKDRKRFRSFDKTVRLPVSKATKLALED